MKEIKKMAQIDQEQLSNMPLEGVVRGFYRNAARRQEIVKQGAPQDVVEASERAGQAYMKEIHRRLGNMKVAARQEFMSFLMGGDLRVSSAMKSIE